MENSNLTSLADALLQKKAEALRQSGTAKKKKGKDGALVFWILFAVCFIGGLIVGNLHFTVVVSGGSMDFHEIGKNIFYVSIFMDLLTLVFALTYLSLYREGKHELAEAEKVLHSPTSR